MMEEIDTTNKFANEIPDGTYIFKITKIERFFSPADFWVFSLDYQGGSGQQTLFANMLGPLLRVLGCEEREPNKFLWDSDLQVNKYFKATVGHSPDRKNPTKIRQHMGGFEKVDEETIPF